MAAVVHNTDKWIAENKQFFAPPVCNKMMHSDGQMKLFYVGGPNQRKDYHIEEGEELFYMLKGDMCLKVVEKGVHVDLPIKEGEIFLLPARIAHSPQRQADTIGLVIERDRDMDELDGLRYYVEKDGRPTLESLYEKWFHCEDLGTQLIPVIKDFFASEQYKTGKPIPGTIPEKAPIILNSELTLQQPFNLHHWLDENRHKLHDQGSIQLWGNQTQFQVFICGKGAHSGQHDNVETFIWQLEGTSSAIVAGESHTLNSNDTMLVKAGKSYSVSLSRNSIALICYQDPARKNDSM
ncbi:3-hydroxyanthranilate 3,4-dioxygenase-like isoform X2 [Gigantopelta aegis]|uniref:3-hydroxyanthranilate 3,4-dioxygenase-like isoform X2 n=2 Tax=Gigantopelta aegis TaxID=1735272 RepID=UPI001B8896E8|nr:3-hydroxyanthranilate 3,4-dioxygenase-like isoform X2 [Gigantopelta aegis]